MDMTRAAKCLKVIRAVGEWWAPTCGIMPGCQVATRVQNLVLEWWRKAVSTACRGAALRCWVDDSTFAGRGEASGCAVWIGATSGFEDFAQGDGAKVNRTKSGVGCSRARMQRLVEQAEA